MPSASQLPPDRFFARVDAFSLACPACGEVITVRKTVGRPNLSRRKAAERAKSVYNPVTSRLHCPWCRARWVVGLVVYPIDPRRPGGQPSDQKPTVKELMALRAQAGGWYLHHAKQGTEAVNLRVTAECICPLGVAGWTPGCPVHGVAVADVEAATGVNQGKRCNTCSGRGYPAGVPEAQCTACGGSGRA